MPQGLLDHRGCIAWKIRCADPCWNPVNRMAREIVNHGQRSTVQSIELQQSNLRIHRANSRHFIVPRHGICPPHICFTAVCQLQPTVLHYSHLLACSRTRLYRLQTFPGRRDSLDCPFQHVAAHHAMTMAGIGKNALRRNAQSLLQSLPYCGQPRIRNMSNAANRYRIQSDQHCRLIPLLQDQCFYVQRIILGHGFFRDLRTSGACQQLPAALFFATDKTAGEQEGDGCSHQKTPGHWRGNSGRKERLKAYQGGVQSAARRRQFARGAAAIAY